MATTQMQRKQQKTSNWSTMFPTEQVTAEQSTLFVKKLLAVAISNISYLRTVFPEHAFGDRCLEDLNLKILRDDSACPGACQVIQWVKGCFDALDKKYLRMIIMALYKDDEKPDTIVESYTFKFSYNADNHESISIYRNGNKITGAYSAAETRKATIKLLRTIVVLTQTLKPLPDDVMMTMKLLYYDDVTPHDYEPPGFQATCVEDFNFKDEPLNIRVGDIQTPFHEVKLRIRTECQQFALCEGEEEEKNRTTTDDTMEVDPPQDTTQKGLVPLDVTNGLAKEPQETAQTPNDQHRTRVCNTNNIETPSSESESPLVRCPCGYNKDEGLMILCGLCNIWQHAACFGLLCEDDVPELHICDLCAQIPSNPCTDPFLPSLDAVPLQAHCLWRRALLSCSELNRVLPHTLAKRMNIEVSVAQGLVNRLEREEYIRPPSKGRGKSHYKTVQKDAIKKEGFKKYFQIPQPIETPQSSPIKTPSKIEQLTEKASSLKIGMPPPVKPLTAAGWGEQEYVRRSPRLAKRARALTDESVEFEISSSQDHKDTAFNKMGGERKRKRRKASIASRSIIV